ncbi:MAG TPA: MFS transporter [Acidimicrobiales bacterium]|nr:MFS transporter [Acidimicrobiales bacterium]
MPTRPPTRYPPGFWVIWTTVALDLVGFGIIVPILPRYAERFGASGIQVGLLVASFSAAQFVCSPLLGRLSDRVGRKPVLLLSLFGTAIGSFVTAAAGSLWVLFAGRIIDGMSGASVAVAQGAVTDVAPEADRPRLLGVLSAAFGIGFVIGPAIGGLASLGGPHLPFVVAGTVALINAMIAIRRLPETRRPAAPEARARSASPLTRLWTLALVGFLAICAFSGFETTFALFADRRFGLTEGPVAVVFLAVGLLLVVVQIRLVGPVSARLGPLGALQLGLTCNAIGLALLAVTRSWLLLVPALALLTVGQGIALPNLTAAVANRAPDEQRGEALGFQQRWQAMGRIVGPVIAGVLFQQIGVGAPYVAGAALAAAAVTMLARAPALRRVASSV